jgi:hypothetical protein
MDRRFAVFLVIGLAVVVAGVIATLYGTKGAHLTLDGKILKVRSLATDEKSSIVVVDFRVTNPTNTPFVVREGQVKITAPDGKEVEGDTIARSDINRVFDYYKILGSKYNEVLIQRDRIDGGKTMDRMIAARFDLPATDIDQRKSLTLTLIDVDGPTFSFKEGANR